MDTYEKHDVAWKAYKNPEVSLLSTFFLYTCFPKFLITVSRTSRVTNASIKSKTSASTVAHGPTGGHTGAPRPSTASAPPQMPTVSTFNDSQTSQVSGDGEEVVMTADNPPRFIITQKEVDDSHSDNEGKDEPTQEEQQQPKIAEQLSNDSLLSNGNFKLFLFLTWC